MLRKARNYATEAIKEYDFFGHPVELNFNNKGSTHNTFVGGFTSIWLRLFMFLYVVLTFNKMFTYGNNSESSATFIIDMDPANEGSIVDIPLKDMRVNLFLVVRW